MLPDGNPVPASSTSRQESSTFWTSALLALMLAASIIAGSRSMAWITCALSCAAGTVNVPYPHPISAIGTPHRFQFQPADDRRNVKEAVPIGFVWHSAIEYLHAILQPILV